MDIYNYKFVGNKLIMRVRDRLCESEEELISSDLFKEVLARCIKDLAKKESPLLKIFDKNILEIDKSDIDSLTKVFFFLAKIQIDLISKIVKNSERFIREPSLLADFVEHFYNYWRDFERFLVCESMPFFLEKRPYRTFNSTIESLTNLVRGTYRDIEENITGIHPNIYRQVRAGAEIATIVSSIRFDFGSPAYNKLNEIPLIRQILINPPLLFNSPMNKRTGSFERVNINPVEAADLDPAEWLCYPAKVGPLLINIYFHEKFYDLGFSLSNLFALAEDQFLNRVPDAVFLFGINGPAPANLPLNPTIFFDDEENNILSASIPGSDEFGYFGYLKKMALTLYNIKMMKSGRLPFHGAMVNIELKNDISATILIVGDTGAGKSETLEAFRMIGRDLIRNITIIADDMGSLEIDQNGNVKGYGTEIGAFVRLDDLQPGYAFGQLDRTIILNPGQTNSRVVLPVTTYANVTRGYKIDYVFYANNYEDVDESHPIIERYRSAEDALRVFNEGKAMSKGTTTSTGLTETYFVNVFGAVQYRDLHESLALRFFEQYFRLAIFTGQLRTRLGITGSEKIGAAEAARELLKLISERSAAMNINSR
ncbi:MAG: phosphoenolpyruvate carboxykinase [Brevinematales bacterium]|jgi:hypothetical protein